MAKLPPKPPSTRERALGMLARRELSQRELKRKLIGRGAAKDEAETTIASLADAHLQSDGRFAAMTVRRRIADGYGPLRIAMELASHGISREAIRAALDEDAPDWNALAASAYRRKFGKSAPADTRERMKRASWLAQRGFSADVARRVAALTESDS